MRLFSIRAYDSAEDTEPSRIHMITASNEDEARDIFETTAYGDQHEHLVISAGIDESDLSGPKYWGYTSGKRILKAPRT